MIAFFKKLVLDFLPLPLKIYLLRRKGTVGSNVRIGSGSWIYSDDFVIGNNVSIGKNSKLISAKVRLGNDVMIAENVLIQAVKSLEIQDESQIGKNTTIGGGQTHESTLFIGKKVHVYQDCFLNTTLPLTIEDGVGIGGGTYIFTHGSWQNAYEGFPYGFGAVTIKKNAWLPWRVFVMPGVTIGEEATIGSNALVGKDIPPRSFAVGIPAKVIKQGNEYIKEMTLTDKVKLFKEIFERFSGHLNFFRKISSEIHSTESSVELITSDNRRYLFTLNSEGLPENTTLITEADIHRIPGNIFDLRGKVSRYEAHVYTDDLRDIMTNFGIRFDRQS